MASVMASVDSDGGLDSDVSGVQAKSLPKIEPPLASDHSTRLDLDPHAALAAQTSDVGVSPSDSAFGRSREGPGCGASPMPGSEKPKLLAATTSVRVANPSGLGFSDVGEAQRIEVPLVDLYGEPRGTVLLSLTTIQSGGSGSALLLVTIYTASGLAQGAELEQLDPPGAQGAMSPRAQPLAQIKKRAIVRAKTFHRKTVRKLTSFQMYFERLGTAWKRDLIEACSLPTETDEDGEDIPPSLLTLFSHTIMVFWCVFIHVPEMYAWVSCHLLLWSYFKARRTFCSEVLQQLQWFSSLPHCSSTGKS